MHVRARLQCCGTEAGLCESTRMAVLAASWHVPASIHGDQMTPGGKVFVSSCVTIAAPDVCAFLDSSRTLTINSHRAAHARSKAHAEQDSAREMALYPRQQSSGLSMGCCSC